MKYWPLAFLALVGCGDKPNINSVPRPQKQVIIEKQVPVPVLCKVVVTKPQLSINSVNPDAPLEHQNGSLRATIAEQAVYITDLVAAVIGCGGTVK